MEAGGADGSAMKRARSHQVVVMKQIRDLHMNLIDATAEEAAAIQKQIAEKTQRLETMKGAGEVRSASEALETSG